MASLVGAPHAMHFELLKDFCLNLLYDFYCMIFEFLKHFCKFSFYDFHFIIPFGLGGLTSMIEMLRNHRIRIADLAMMISHLPKLKN